MNYIYEQFQKIFITEEESLKKLYINFFKDYDDIIQEYNIIFIIHLQKIDSNNDALMYEESLCHSKILLNSNQITKIKKNKYKYKFTYECENYKQQNKLFYVIRYNDTESDPLKCNFTQYKNKFVKIIVENKTKPYVFDRFLDSFYSAQVANLTILEDQVTDIISVDKVDASLDTVSMINNEIDNMSEIQNKEKLKKIIHELYIESISAE